MNAELSIVTTCHPNAAVMETFYSAIDHFAAERQLAVEVITVNNLLPDGHHPLASTPGNHIAITALKHDQGVGQAGSMIRGFIAASAGRVLSIDPDMTSSLYAVDDMLALSDQGCAVVIARRELRYRPYWRAAATWVFNLLVSVTLGFRVRDVNSPMFLVRREVIDELAALSLPVEAYKLKLFTDYRHRLAEVLVKDTSSEAGVPSTYPLGALVSLFFKRLWLAIRLRLAAR